ncbi:hypothetical protein S83_000009 [Arachis hypogaea]
MSSTPTPCAACKFLRRECTPECIFAPYFPANNPERFECVHRVFGASNVGNILNALPPSQREDAAKSFAFQAEASLRSPVYGCTLQVPKREPSASMNPQAIQGPFNPQEKPLSSPPAHLGPPCGPNIVQYSAHLGPFKQEMLQAQELDLLQAQELAAAKQVKMEVKMEPVAGIEPAAAAAPYGGDIRRSEVFGLMRQIQVLFQQQKHQIRQLLQQHRRELQVLQHRIELRVLQQKQQQQHQQQPLQQQREDK